MPAGFPSPERRSAASFYRCGQCSVDWPPMAEFAECPGCGTPTAILSGRNRALPLPEARSQASHMKFERYLKRESSQTREDRRERYRASQDMTEAEREAAQTKAKDDFHRVVTDAGFQAWEKDAISDLEEKLPEAHKDKP